jgi:hypothetical protein
MLSEIEKLARSTEYLKIFFACMFIGIITLPFMRELWSKEQREMIKGMKGSDGQWQWSEIWEYNSLRFAKGFFATIIFMVLMKTLFTIEYPWELYVLTFLGTLGSNGIGAFLIYIKSKHEK